MLRGELDTLQYEYRDAHGELLAEVPAGQRGGEERSDDAR